MKKNNLVKTCYGKIDADLLTRLSAVKLVVLDVDGTLTAGGVYLDNTTLELKQFNVKDGYGISSLLKAKIECAVITGRDARLTLRRMQEVGIKHVMQGQIDKTAAFEKLCANLNIGSEESAVIGDDLNDLPMFKKAAFTACPKDGHPYMKKIADYVTTKKGGKGAVRELCDLILMSQGFLNPDGGVASDCNS